MPRSKSNSPTLYDRLADEKIRVEAALALVEPGLMRTRLLQKLRQLDVAVHVDRWLSSPGLRAPVQASHSRVMPKSCVGPDWESPS